MGPFVRLRAEVKCYNCGAHFTPLLQLFIGWCAWFDYELGDPIEWMTNEQRERVALQPDLQVNAEGGSPEWVDFATSSGDDEECPHCGARGSILAIVKDNRFRETLFTWQSLAYGDTLVRDELEKFLGGRTDWQSVNTVDLYLYGP